MIEYLDNFDIDNICFTLSRFPETVNQRKEATNDSQSYWNKICGNDSKSIHQLEFIDIMLTIQEKQALSILIVDDEPKNIQLLGNILSGEGYQVEFATNGENALDWALSRQFDAILLDIMMPEMDGFEVCRRLKENPAAEHIPIIFLTAKTDTSSVIQGFEEGAVDYVTKPFQKSELLARVQTHLGMSLNQTRLQKANIELKNTQAQLVQSEKMGSLGVLVAGVAHEINNPTNFIHSGVGNLKKRIEELEDFIYQLAGDSLTDPIRRSIAEKFEPLHQNTEAILEGSLRIRTIVRDLRTFSRLEESHQNRVSISNGIKSTIPFVQANYKNAVEIVCDFQADPIIDCFPAHLNQVFMNLAINACQAIVEKQTSSTAGFTGRITIRTFIRESWLVVSFQDNGAGMKAETRNKVFEPFFTTKPVGEGTGLGLAVSFGIIEKHKGKIEVTSELGQGSTFAILLPLTRESRNS